jgi:hypothetical protein
LIETYASLESTKRFSPPAPLYFGIGLCNGGANPRLTQGMPIDVLMLILTAEYVGTQKFILVADLHAETNGFDKNEIDGLAKQQQETLLRAIQNLGFENWDIIIASAIDNCAEYKAILNSFQDSNNYFQRELSDIEWFKQEKRVNLKLGWALKGSKTDEVAFDNRYTEVFGNGMSFMYTVPGRTFDPKKPRTAPYFCMDQETRIMLRRDECVIEKFRDASRYSTTDTINGYKNLLSGMMRMYNKVVEPTSGPLEERVQYVIDRCSR